MKQNIEVKSAFCQVCFMSKSEKQFTVDFCITVSGLNVVR
jgi:hypothetical protein